MTASVDQTATGGMSDGARMSAASPPSLTEPYLDDPRRIAIIFGAFFLLCLPLAVLMRGATTNASLVRWLVLVNAYGVLVGYTHFGVTFSLYLNSKNLAYFRSTPKNVVVYFVVPITIMVVWFCLGYFGINQPTRSRTAMFIAYLVWFTLVTKLADYLHVVRQHFGVLQLFKRHVPAPFPAWIRRAENTFFMVVLALQMLTFKGGLDVDNLNAAYYDIHNPYTQVATCAAVLLFVAILAGYAKMAMTVAIGRRRTVFLPLQYFLLQTASASLAVIWTPLYVAGLAMHYVEYHVVMYPRIFRSQLEGKSQVDRLSLWLRAHKPVFYVVLVALSYLMMLSGISRVPPAAKDFAWLVTNLLNGIFMAHYFVEAFVWKFGLPFFRQSLSPLYFPPPKKPA